jgi:hypothetical protein
MRVKYDTSINIDSVLLKRVENYSKIFRISKQEVVLKILSHFIKRSRYGVFIKRRTVGYQVKKGIYKKLTLHLNSEELEIFRQIRVVTLLSTSYVFYIAMDLFGYKLFNRAKKSKWTLTCIRNYFFSGSYPEFIIFIKKTMELYRYWVAFT